MVVGVRSLMDSDDIKKPNQTSIFFDETQEFCLLASSTRNDETRTYDTYAVNLPNERRTRILRDCAHLTSFGRANQFEFFSHAGLPMIKTPTN